MIPLAGYADRLSVRPGETITFRVSNATGEKTAVRVVRVVCADPNPDGPGVRIEPVAGRPPSEIVAPEPQTTCSGSYAIADIGADLEPLDRGFTIVATVWPTYLGRTVQPIMSWLDTATSSGAALLIDRDARLSFRIGQGEGRVATWQGGPRLAEREWAHVALIYDGEKRTACLATWSTRDGSHSGPRRSMSTLAAPLAGPAGKHVFIGAGMNASFDGKIEWPRLFARAVSPEELDLVVAGEHVASLLAAWDFSKEVHTQRIIDVGPNEHHGRLVNTPARAMRGANWTGREHCFRHAPEQYGAIHFHSDDLDDCRWPVTHEWTVPQELRSGIYALMLEAGSAKDNVPFYVLPPRGVAHARICVLASTFTYLAYHNQKRREWVDDEWRNAWKSQSIEWLAATKHNPSDHPDYGASTYDVHTDGSGIHTASWSRPMLNMRVGYFSYPFPLLRGSGVRHFTADTHLTCWLESIGYAYDVITDWELHHEGAALLERYQVVLTATHSEYHTREMLDALEAYRDGGGRLMFLGGNGFYWKVALSPDKPGQIEIRRGEGGIRAWAAEPGEYYHQFDGDYGGLWRRSDRPPQRLSGVGFTAEGSFSGMPYRIDPRARTNPRTEWIFDGVPDQKIGGFGFFGHGAAGFEVDRADHRLGTPMHAVVVASTSLDLAESCLLVPEEILTHGTTISGKPPRDLIRADMTFFETPHDGAVFSTGSITYCGSLLSDGGANTIARVTRNILDRFMDETAGFPIPSDDDDGTSLNANMQIKE